LIDHQAQRRHSPARIDAAAGVVDKDKMFFSSHHPQSHSALAALTDW